jgi:hypothetical protein
MLILGKFVELDGGIKAEVIEVKGNRATRVRLTIPNSLKENPSDVVGGIPQYENRWYQVFILRYNLKSY